MTSDGDRYIEARKGARQMRRKAFWTHRYQCDYTPKTCWFVAYRTWGVWPEVTEFGMVDFEVSDGHY